jgi:hypothetical protein
VECNWVFVHPKPTCAGLRERDCIRMAPAHSGCLCVQIWTKDGEQRETHEIVDLSASGLCLKGETQLAETQRGRIIVYLATCSGVNRELAKGEFEVRRTWKTVPGGLAVQLSEMSDTWSRSVPKNWSAT